MTDQPVPSAEESGESLNPIPALTEEEYVTEVLRSAPPPEMLRFPDDRLLLGVLGLAGEAGEIADLVKKHCYHRHPLDREHLLDELGEVLWSFTWLCYVLETSLGELMLGNVTKLRVRSAAGVNQEHDRKE